MSKATSKKKSGTNWVKWGVRIAVGGVLAVFICLAIMNNLRKGEAEKTATAWREAIRDKKFNELISIENIEEKMQGTPAISEGKITKRGLNVKIYAWKQFFFADYEIHVEYSKLQNQVDVVDPMWGKAKNDDGE